MSFVSHPELNALLFLSHCKKRWRLILKNVHLVKSTTSCEDVCEDVFSDFSLLL